MIEVGVAGRFEAAHRLRGEFGPATRTHGHTYRVEISVRGPALGPDAALVDVGRLRSALQACLAELHLANLDEVAAFAGANTTAETVADHVWQHVSGELVPNRGLVALRVVVFESPDVWAAVDRELGE
jgi:6-pyruvoyltetrahydropterin/6-carboxytetrahydropterin synthase